MQMTITVTRLVFPLYVTAVLARAGACASGPKAPTQAYQTFEQAVNTVTDNVFGQVKGPAVLSALGKKIVVIDPLIDSASGQQTVATHLAEQKISERVKANFAHLEIIPFEPANLAKAQYLLNGTLTPQTGGEPNRYRLKIALTEIKTSQVVAQANVNIRDAGVDSTPTPYFRDSP